MKKFFSIGNIFKINNEYYILAQVDSHKAGLICLDDGTRWKPPVLVSDVSKITLKEMREMSLPAKHTFISNTFQEMND